jgi:hypothetical protein
MGLEVDLWNGDEDAHALVDATQPASAIHQQAEVHLVPPLLSNRDVCSLVCSQL